MLALPACERAAPAPDNAGIAAPAADRRAPPGFAALELDGRRLRSDLPFGSARAAVVRELGKSLGPPTGSDRIDECGEGAMDFVRFGGLSVAFQDDRLVGWFARPPFAGQTTQGLRVGEPRSALGPVPVEETSLGLEFRDSSGVSGVLDESGDRIAALWAGSACVFR